MIFRVVLLFCVVPAALVICLSAQPPEHPTFGWSLTVDRGSKEKQDRVEPKRQMPSDLGGDDEIRIESSLVLSDVLVLDRKGLPVTGLGAGDFEIVENGRPQRIDVFEKGSSTFPRSIFLIIDHSLSQWRYIDKTIDAAKTLVEQLRPSDRMAIISDDVSLIADLTGDRQVLRKALETLRNKCHSGIFGQSKQYSALYAVLNEKIDRNGSRNIVIFQTDGDELAALGTYLSRVTFGSLAKTANRKGVTVYTVYTGAVLKDKNKQERIEIARSILSDEATAFHLIQEKNPSYQRTVPSVDYLLSRAERLRVEEAALAEIARRSGGISQFLEAADQAANIYQNILSDIGHRYLIGYYLSDEDQTRRGKEREIKVSLRTKGSYKVVGGRNFVTN